MKKEGEGLNPSMLFSLVPLLGIGLYLSRGPEKCVFSYYMWTEVRKDGQVRCWPHIQSWWGGGDIKLVSPSSAPAFV